MALSTTVVFTGFEENHIDDGLASTTVGGTGTVSIVSTAPKSGTYHLRCNCPAGTDIAHVSVESSGANATERWGTFGFRAATLPAATYEPIATLGDSTTAGVFLVSVTSGGNLQIRDMTGATQYQSNSATALAAGTWYNVQLYANATTDVTEVWINGTKEIATTSADFTFANTASDRLRLGKFINLNSNVVDFFYDDVIDSNAAEQPDKDAKVAVAIPTGNGTEQQWTAGTGASDYLEVDELTTDGSTTAVVSTATNDASTFAMQDIGSMVPAVGASDTIHAMKAQVRWHRAASNSSTGQIRIRSDVGGTPTAIDSGNFTLASAMDTAFFSQVTDPDTGIAWTPAGLNNTEIGVEDVHATYRGRCSTVNMHVLFTAAAAAGGRIYQLAGAGGALAGGAGIAGVGGGLAA